MSSALQGKRILLVLGGGISSFKCPDLIRRLRERGAEVHPVVTESAKQFVTPLTLAALAGQKVHDSLFSLTDETEMGHIELSRMADLVVVAPATANLLARMANGLADDLATTLLLATDKRTLVVPAMNLRMWLHPATRRNVDTLKGDGVLFCGPVDGDMACGEHGPGRMSEPLEIVAAIEAALGGDTRLPLPAGTGAKPANGRLAGRRIVVTSGPTHEPIDPVRYIANRSSGKQGHAIARALADLGADVTLVAGPVSLSDPPGVTTRHVETAREMLAAVQDALPADVFVAAAAVADWRVASEGQEKIKKAPGETAPSFRMVENPDILATVSQMQGGRPRLVVGFAAETEKVIDHARAKLARKGCDLIVANDVSPETGIMGGDRNKVHLVTRAGVTDWPDLAKEEVARRLAGAIADLLEDDGDQKASA